MQVTNLFRHPAYEYIVAFSILGKEYINAVSWPTLEEAKESLDKQRKYLNPAAVLKVFKATGKTDNLYIDAEEVV